jgi:hypothetical protein
MFCFSSLSNLTIASDESKCDMTPKDILAGRDEVFKDEIGRVKGINQPFSTEQSWTTTLNHV